MPGILRTKTKDGKWRAWYKSHLTGSDGRRKTLKFTGTRSRRETLALANERQVQEDRIAAGLVPAPEDRQPWRDFVDTVQDYLAYGEAQGGRGGRPWGRTHARNQRARLAWWHEQIGFRTLEDLMKALRPVETALVKLRDRGRTSKTLRDYQESLQSFCRWCIDRGYLPSDPLARLRKFDMTPRITRRPLASAEIARILALVPPDRVLLYEVALFTGLRAGELAHLRSWHLDMERGGLRLEAEWTKNRRPGFQPLPRYLLEKLAGTGTSPSEVLLKVPSHPARTFDEDLRLAGIEKASPDGVLVFHSWRATYGTLLDELGASPKETQELMRHATPMLTMQRYVQARLDRRQQLVEDMASVIWSARGVPGTLEAGTDEDVTALKFNDLREWEGVEAAGIEPASESLRSQCLHAYPGTKVSPLPNLPSRARKTLAWFRFRAALSPGGGSSGLSHIVAPDPDIVGGCQGDAGRD